jgi:hypothetical protein
MNSIASLFQDGTTIGPNTELTSVDKLRLRDLFDRSNTRCFNLSGRVGV